MKKQYEKNNRLPAKVLSALADKETREWPPTCLGFFYQTKRPKNDLQRKKDKHADVTR